MKKFYMYLDNNINNIIWIFHYERKVLIVWFCNKYKLYQKLLSSQDKKKLKLIQTIYKCFSDSSKHEGCQYCILKYIYIYIQQILRIDHKIENRTNTGFFFLSLGLLFFFGAKRVESSQTRLSSKKYKHLSWWLDAVRVKATLLIVYIYHLRSLLVFMGVSVTAISHIVWWASCLLPNPLTTEEEWLPFVSCRFQVCVTEKQSTEDIFPPVIWGVYIIYDCTRRHLLLS